MYISVVNRFVLLLIISVSILYASTYTTKDFSSTHFNTLGITSTVNQNVLSPHEYLEFRKFVKSNIDKIEDPMQWFYQEPLAQKIVEDFLLQKIGNKEIVDAVFIYTVARKLPISLVFSLIFIESSFSTQAVNHNRDSVDYGLFQLNSKTFRNLDTQDFFHLETNVKNGTAYLEYAFTLDPEPRIALAIYNAGPSRPLRGQTPQSTQKYVKKILDYSKKLDKEFYWYVWKTLELDDIDNEQT